MVVFIFAEVSVRFLPGLHPDNKVYSTHNGTKFFASKFNDGSKERILS